MMSWHKYEQRRKNSWNRIYYRDIGLVDELPQSMADAVAEKIPEDIA